MPYRHLLLGLASWTFSQVSQPLLDLREASLPFEPHIQPIKMPWSYNPNSTINTINHQNPRVIRKHFPPNSSLVGSEILTAVVKKSSVFWDLTLYSPLEANWRFGGTCRLHPQGRKISQARNQRESRWQRRLTSNGLQRIISQKM
jgi:hypothetical protein